MFNSIHVHESGPTYVTKTVHEHRAPTDDSVRLLNELTIKARENLVATFSTSNNVLQATWARHQDELMGQDKYFCKFVLNGRAHQIYIDVEDTGMQGDGIEVLYEKLCNRLASELMLPLLAEIRRKP